MKRGPSALSLKGRALQLLAQREHSRAELRRKLLPYAALTGLPAGEASAASDPGGAADPATPDGPGAPGGRAAAPGRDRPQPLFERSTERRGAASPAVAAAVDALLDWLEAGGHLSDERFIESRVHARASRFGTQRIRQELARHGTRLPADTAQALKASEAERARQVWMRKFGAPAADAAGRARQMRFLATRGFDPEVVRRVVPPAAPGLAASGATGDRLPDADDDGDAPPWTA